MVEREKMKQVDPRELFSLVNKGRKMIGDPHYFDPEYDEERQLLDAKYNMIAHAIWCQIESKIFIEDRICPICKREVFQKFCTYCGNCGQLLEWVNKRY